MTKQRKKYLINLVRHFKTFNSFEQIKKWKLMKQKDVPKSWIEKGGK